MSRKRKSTDNVDNECTKRVANQSSDEQSAQRPVCALCRRDVKNKYFLGKMLTVEGMSCHYYCILFAPPLQQNGSHEDGFKGFLRQDVEKEVRRGRLLTCTYCHEKGAGIGCSVTSCKTQFHLPCGLVNDSFHAFHDPSKSYPSYCSKHRPKQKTTRSAIRTNPIDKMCAICRDSVDNKPTAKSLWAPCCGHWQHRECVLKLAYHAAKHHLKCPNCNNKDVFVTEMKTHGVNVPSRDASWEKGTGFADLYAQLKYECSAEKCLSPKGRDFNGDGEWELLKCDGCGADATHGKCAGLDSNTDDWMCKVCQPVLTAAANDDSTLKTITNNVESNH